MAWSHGKHGVFSKKRHPIKLDPLDLLGLWSCIKIITGINLYWSAAAGVIFSTVFDTSLRLEEKHPAGLLVQPFFRKDRSEPGLAFLGRASSWFREWNPLTLKFEGMLGSVEMWPKLLWCLFLVMNPMVENLKMKQTQAFWGRVWILVRLCGWFPFWTTLKNILLQYTGPNKEPCMQQRGIFGIPGLLTISSLPYAYLFYSVWGITSSKLERCAWGKSDSDCPLPNLTFLGWCCLWLLKTNPYAPWDWNMYSTYGPMALTYGQRQTKYSSPMEQMGKVAFFFQNKVKSPSQEDFGPRQDNSNLRNSRGGENLHFVETFKRIQWGSIHLESICSSKIHPQNVPI